MLSESAPLWTAAEILRGFAERSARGARNKHKMDMSSVAQDEISSKRILSGSVDSRELPEWFREQQREAWKQFETLPSPTRKDQLWRFSNVDLLDLSPFQIPPLLSEHDRRNVLKYSRGLDGVAGRMIFAN